MKGSNWIVAAVLANVVVICLSHPDGGNIGKRNKAEVSGDHLPHKDARRTGIDVLLMTRNDGDNVLPNDARQRDTVVVKTSDIGGQVSVKAAGRNIDVASSRPSHSDSDRGRGSVATAMINFNLGGPLPKSGGYRDTNAVNVGAKHIGRGKGFDQNSNDGGKRYNNQENVSGRPQSINSIGGVNIGGGHTGGGGGGFGGVIIAGGSEGIAYSGPESERNSGGYDGGLGNPNKGVHRVVDGDEYRKQVNVGGIVSGHNEVSNSGIVVGGGGGGGNFGDKFISGSGGGFDGVHGGRDFGYSETESEQNSLGYNKGVHSGVNSGSESNGEEYNIAKVNGAPALVGGGVGGIYLSKTSNEDAYSAPAFIGNKPSDDYSKLAESGGVISGGGYNDPEVKSGKVSGFYTPPEFGASMLGSIIQSGILQAEFSATDNSGGYGRISRRIGGRRY